jgi:hypothetical protein
MIKFIILISWVLLLERTYTQEVINSYTYYYVSPTTATGCYIDPSYGTLQCQSAPSSTKLYFPVDTPGVIEIINSDGYKLTESSTGTTLFNIFNTGTTYRFNSAVSSKYLYGTFSWPSTSSLKFCPTAWT